MTGSVRQGGLSAASGATVLHCLAQVRGSKEAETFKVCQGKRSAPFVTTGTVNGEIYLIPTIFWPDLASFHYSNVVLELYEANGVTFVPKDMKPPNAPELRPIETYWAIMKQALRKHLKEIKSEKDMRKKWVSVQKNLQPDVVQNLMNGVKRKMRAYSYGIEVE